MVRNILHSTRKYIPSVLRWTLMCLTGFTGPYLLTNRQTDTQWLIIISWLTHWTISTQTIQSNSRMHHYECVALYKDINLQRGRFWASSLASCSCRSREEISPWKVFIQVVCGVCILIHSRKMSNESKMTRLDNGRTDRQWLIMISWLTLGHVYTERMINIDLIAFEQQQLWWSLNTSPIYP